MTTITKNYFCCKIAQRGQGQSVEFALFVVGVKDIAQWAGVRRVGEHEKGTQRILKGSRTRAIKRFLAASNKNTIPVSILIAFDYGIAKFESLQSQIDKCLDNRDATNGKEDNVNWGILSFTFEEGLEEIRKPALIVDGQHRLKGMDLLENEDIPIIVAALIDATPEEQAFQFVVINNKAAKVPTDNVKAIIASQIDETALQERLLAAGVNYGNISAALRDINEDPSSPFYMLLDWPLNITASRRIIQLTTIEACLRSIRNSFAGLEDDDDTQKEIFYSIWDAIKNTYSDLWITNEKFMSKVNITALNEFISERLAFAWEGGTLNLDESAQISALTRNILSLIPQAFWQIDWIYKLQDNSVVRETIKEDLKKISQNTRIHKDWNENLKLVGGEE